MTHYVEHPPTLAARRLVIADATLISCFSWRRHASRTLARKKKLCDTYIFPPALVGGGCLRVRVAPH
eukprot:516277-Pyramimonas_sp.AAC.2